MAKNQDKKDENKENSLVNNLDSFRGASKLLTSSLYGTDEKFTDENNNDLTDINNTIKKVSDKYKEPTGENFIEFYNATVMNDSTTNQRVKKDTKKQIVNISKIIEDNSNNSSNSINELLVAESDRISLYNSYRLIYDNIPQLAQALNTYVDNILSPDDFTKDIFNVFIDNQLTTTIQDEDKSEIINNCDKLIKNYKLETFSERIIHNALMLGDEFVAVLSLDQELEKMSLNENTMPHHNSSKISSNDVLITQEEVSQISELFEIDKNNNLSESTNNISNEVLIKENIAELINENFIIADSSQCLLESNINTTKEFMDKNNKADLFNSYKETIFKDATKKRSKSNQEIHVQGSVLKRLEPDRIVKLSLDDVVYGYFYIENLENAGDVLTRGPYGATANIFSNYASFQNTQPDLINTKYKLITDIFVKNIAHKIDRKFINNHKEFKNTIYNLLRQNYILNKQVRMVYLKPDEVIHFGKGIEEYHESIFKPIMFAAKLYLTVLTSQVMLRLVRSPEKRVYYIETDVDNDTEGVVQTFIRDVKTKEFTVSDFSKDINTLLRSVGTFEDYYVPVVGGQKPVEIDT